MWPFKNDKLLASRIEQTAEGKLPLSETVTPEAAAHPLSGPLRTLLAAFRQQLVLSRKNQCSSPPTPRE